MKYFIYFLLILLSLIGCQSQELGDIFNMLSANDKTLPCLLSLNVESTNSASVQFDEDIVVVKATLDGEKLQYKKLSSSKLQLTFPKPLSVSEAKELYLIVEDLHGNSSSFIFTISGRNDRIPNIKITEFSSKGTPTQPDRIELLAYTEGNTEGIYCANGTKGNETFGFTLPSIDVKRGDYIVIYWSSKPEKESFTNNTGNTTYQIEAKSDVKLATNNGCFVLYDTISGNGEILDALVYSDNEATTYSGFGNAKVEKSYKELVADFEWIDEPVYSKHTTSTRTINRFNGTDDTNRNIDFYICDTKCLTFGNSNNEKKYIPPVE